MANQPYFYCQEDTQMNEKIDDAKQHLRRKAREIKRDVTRELKEDSRKTREHAEGLARNQKNWIALGVLVIAVVVIVVHTWL